MPIRNTDIVVLKLTGLRNVFQMVHHWDIETNSVTHSLIDGKNEKENQFMSKAHHCRFSHFLSGITAESMA